MNDIETLRRILATNRVIAVVGLSAEWHRPSFFAAKYMQEHGYRIIPINPKYPEILGRDLLSLARGAAGGTGRERRHRRLLSAHRRHHADRREAVAIGAKVLWQQIGVVNLEADALARRHGLDSVMDRCIKIEHARLFGGLHWVGVNTGIVSAQAAAIPSIGSGHGHPMARFAGL